MPALAAAPPSSGTILQQSTPAPQAPTAPGPVLRLPSPKLQRSQSAVRIPVKRIHVQGNTLLPEDTLSRLAKTLEGRTVTLGDLDALAGRITDRYHAAGYPLAYAYVPAQRIQGGLVTLNVIEPRYDRILITGKSRLKASVVRRTLSVSSGQPIAEAPLSRGLLLLERTPGVRVAGTLVPGAQPATSSLQVHLQDQSRARASLGVDNHGGAYTGRTRGTFTASLDNPFGYGSQLAVNGLSTEGGLLHAGGFSALSPNLHDGLRLAVYGSRTVYRLGGEFAALRQSGQANQYGASLRYPLVLRPGRLLQASLDVLRNDFTQTTASIGTQDRSHIDLARLSLSGAYADRWGGMNTAGLSVSHGQLLLDSATARATDAAGPQTAGVFWVGQLNLDRRQRLPARFVLGVNLSGQLASGNLDGNQKFYLGGPDGVMSYPVGEAGGDEGVLLRTRLAHGVPLARLPGRLEAALLAQAGKVWVNRHPYAGASGQASLFRAGAGVGLDYHWRDRVSASLSYVHRVGPDRATAGPAHAGEVWASLKLNG
jgi:hemolysin activation/secretion protein